MASDKKILKGRLAGDHLSQVASKLAHVDMVCGEDIPCEAHVVMSSVGVEARYDQDCLFPYRPYLVMNGEVRALVGELHEGVDGVAYAAGSGPAVRFIYDFNDAELATLARKGLFSPGFDVPALFCDTTFELPVTCSVEVIEPKAEGEAPVVFASIKRPMGIEVDAEKSGYILADYFEASNEGASASIEFDMDELSAEVSGKALEDVHDIELGPVELDAPAVPEVPESAPIEPLYDEQPSEAQALSDRIFAESLASAAADDKAEVEVPSEDGPETDEREDADTSGIEEGPDEDSKELN